MDKKLNRKILFDKKSVTTEVVMEKENPSVERPIKEPLADVLKWIAEHEYFKWSRMCVKIGVDKSNFQKALKSGKIKISEEQRKSIIEILKEYGYSK